MSAAAANLTRRLLDAALSKAKVLPAAAAANAGDSIDLGQVTLGPAADHIEVDISIPATPALVEDKTVIMTLKDSADNTTFTAIPSLATLVVTGAPAAAGGAAASRRLKLPPSTRRYVRLEAAVLAAGGDNTAVSYTLKVLANP